MEGGVGAAEMGHFKTEASAKVSACCASVCVLCKMCKSPGIRSGRCAHVELLSLVYDCTHTLQAQGGVRVAEMSSFDSRAAVQVSV